MDGSVEWLMAVMDLDDVGATWLPGTGGHYILGGRNAKLHWGHNDFKVKEHVLASFFALATGTEGSSLYVYSLSLQFVLEGSEVWTVLCETTHMHKIIILPNLIFFGHGYIQHAGPEWSGENCLRYHIYFILASQVLGDAIYFADGDSLEGSWKGRW